MARLIEEKSQLRLIFNDESPKQIKQKLHKLKMVAIRKLYCIKYRIQQNINVPWKSLKLDPITHNSHSPISSSTPLFNPIKKCKIAMRVRRISLMKDHSQDSKWLNGIKGYIEEESNNPPITKITPYYIHCPSCNIKNKEFEKVSGGSFEKNFSQHLWKWKLKSMEKSLMKQYGEVTSYGQ